MELIGNIAKNGRKSSGISILMDGCFTSASEQEAVEVKIKLVPSTNAKAVLELGREFKVADKLNRKFPYHFVRPHDLVYGSKGEIVSREGEDCTGFVGLAMQLGIDNLAEYLKKDKHSLLRLLPHVQNLVQILDAAHESHVVLMDVKLENVVRFRERDLAFFGDETLPFDNALDLAFFGDEITTDPAVTLANISPEVARFKLALMNDTHPERTFATPEIDVFALGRYGS